MALDKLVDSTQLDSDLTSVANAIRTKGGTSAQLAFPAGFVSAIGDIPSGETAYYTTYSGQPYFKNTVIPDANYTILPSFRNADEMESFVFNHSGGEKNNLSYWLAYCSKLKSAVINATVNFVNNSRDFQSDTALETVQLGGLGRPCYKINNGNVFAGCTQSGLTITIYTTATSLATLPSTISGAPWGASNATIVYKNSTTGEVLV